MTIRFLAARIFVEAGSTDKATDARRRSRRRAARRAAGLREDPRGRGRADGGQRAPGDQGPDRSQRLLDTWIGHFDLGRAYLEAGRSCRRPTRKFDRCIKRRGEALALFLDEEPTFGYFPPVYYYQGRVREGMKNAGFADSYRAYLKVRGNSTEDPLLPEVRRRAGS